MDLPPTRDVLMFAGLSDLIHRHHKMIIIAWMVALVVAVPFLPMVDSVVQYEETEMAPRDLESIVASAYISERFGEMSQQPTTLIVVAAEDVLGEEAKRVVLGIEGDIANASLFGEIPEVKVTSVYSVAERYALNVIKELNTAYMEVNLTAFAIFGLPQTYRTLWQETNATAHILRDVPLWYMEAWSALNASNPGLTIVEVDDLAFQATGVRVVEMAQSLREEQRALLHAWFAVYAQAWNGSIAMAFDPVARATVAHSAAFGNISTSLPLNEQDLLYLGQVDQAFSVMDPGFVNVSAFSKQMLDQRIASLGGPMGTERMALVEEYANSTYAWWLSNGMEPSGPVFEAGVMSVSEAFGSSIPAGDLRELYLGIRQAVGGYAIFNDPPALRSTLSQFIASLPAVSKQLAPRPWVVAEAGDMGSFDVRKASLLSDRIVANSSLSDLPFRIPSDIISLLVSSDNTTTLLTLTYENIDGEADIGRRYVGDIREIVARSVEGTDVRSYVTGTDPLNVDLKEATWQDLGIIEPVTIVLVLVLIGLYFRSFVASSIPPMAIGIALGIAYAMVYLIGAYLFSMHYAVLTLLLTTMMGAGCDYCIFILSRYREERRRGRGKDDSVRQAVIWAGESIATSGATVIIGFGVLSIGRFAMLQSMGIALALGITIALLVSLTLLPSILTLLGDRLFWPAKMERSPPHRTGPGYFTRSARFAIKHARVLVLIAVVISIPTTYMAVTLGTSYDFIGAMGDSQSKRGLEALQEGFGGGKVNPTQVALELRSPLLSNDTYDPAGLAAVENISATLAGLPNVKQVTGPTRPNGAPIDYTNSSVMSQYISTANRMISDDGRSTLLTVIFMTEPFDKAAVGSIQEIRAVAAAVEEDPMVLKMYVGGSTATMYDIAELIQEDFSNMWVLVVLGIYIVLSVVLGSVINPLRSILTILLSVSWTLATTLVLFQVVLDRPVLYLVPMILTLVCLGLGMDYDILLTTRIREEVTKGMETNEAIVHAVERTGGIITACGIIMAAAFGSMMIANGYLLKEFGFALMFAILLDATVVRIYLVPAIMSLLGKWNWWAPGPIQKMNERRNRKRLQALSEAHEGLLDRTEQ